MPLRSRPLRLRIGVTGHRVLPDPPAVSSRIGEFLRHQIGVMVSPPLDPDGSEPRLVFILLSSLAEGADRLAAGVVMASEGGELEAVLPLPAEEYLKDFSLPESKAEFRSWLERSRRVVVLSPGGADAGRKEIREAAYEKAGRWVVDHCDLLVAVWDGLPAKGRGGTAEIVAHALWMRVPLAIVPADGAGVIRCEPGRGILRPGPEKSVPER